jgi:hypothetical protein
MAPCGHVQAAFSSAENGHGPRVYERHDVEADTLHQVVRENLATFTSAIEAGFEGGSLPEFVKAELADYLSCSVLGRGFAHLLCEGCGRSRLVAFTCAGRGFCPTCMGRRMNQTTINLLRHVLPSQTLRQWVLTLPFELRAPVGYEPGLMRTVVRVFADSLKKWYERRLARPSEAAQGGLLTVIQRCSSDLRLSPHLHVVALDGVYVSGSDGQPMFRPLGHLKTDEVADVLQIAKTRILKALERQGAVQLMPDAVTVDEAWAARDPAMAHLAAAAVAGLPPAGLAQRKRLPVPVIDGGRPEIVGKLVVQDHGFNLHAQTRAGGEDQEACARLLRYVLRPPLARERLERLPDHRVRLSLKRPWSDGTFALEMDALALLSRLAAAVPPPRQHVVCYAGVLAPASRLRPLVIPKPESDNTTCANAPPSPPDKDTPQAKPLRSGPRCRYIKWAELLRLTFGLQVDLCPACGGTMKLRALVHDPASIERFLRHQGLLSKPKEIAPARAPPFDRVVTRLHPSPQRELFFDS